MRFFLTRGAELLGLAFTLGLHPVEDVLARRRRIVGAAQAHINDPDAERRHRGIHLFTDRAGDVVPLAGQDRGECFATESPTNRRVDDGLKPSARAKLVANCLVEQQRVFDLVAGVSIHLKAFLVGQDHLFGILRDQAENTLFVIDDVLDERQLEGEPRLLDGPFRLAELEHQRLLRLVDGEKRAEACHDQQGASDERDKTSGTHVSFLPTSCSARAEAGTAQRRCHRQARR